MTSHQRTTTKNVQWIALWIFNLFVIISNYGCYAFGGIKFLRTTRTKNIHHGGHELFLLGGTYPSANNNNENNENSSNSNNDEQKNSTNKDESNHQYQGFNPYTRKRSTQVQSFRQMKLQELMQDMLRYSENSRDDTSSYLRRRECLINAKEYLLEPLEHDDDSAVLDPDSIYDPGMTRQQRYDRYRTVMAERVARAKKTNPKVQRVLNEMMEFVLSHE
jgi:hypothetical protein